MNLRLPHSLGEALLAEATSAAKVEVCGFLAADGTQVRRYIVANRAQRLADRFDMDAADQIAAFRNMREHHARLLAIYHSHPVGEAVPSVHDLEGHSYPEAVALIVAPMAVRGARIRGWRLEGNTPLEQPIEWTEPPCDGPWHDGFL